MVFRLNIGTFNVNFGGWNDDLTQLNLNPLCETIEQFPPHVLFLQECFRWQDTGSDILYRVANRLSEFLPNGDKYLPYLERRPGYALPKAIFISAQNVNVHRWYEPIQAGLPEFFIPVLKTEIAGHGIWLSSVHWRGGFGDSGFERQAATIAQKASQPILLGGDFNCISSGTREVLPDWQRTAEYEPHKLIQKMSYDNEKQEWVARTWPIDMLIGPWNPKTGQRAEWAGFYDVGEHELDSVGKPVEILTPTVNDGIDAGNGLRIDRLIASKRFPGRLIPGSYRVHIPDSSNHPSDHRYVTASFELDQQRGPEKL